MSNKLIDTRHDQISEDMQLQAHHCAMLAVKMYKNDNDIAVYIAQVLRLLNTGVRNSSPKNENSVIIYGHPRVVPDLYKFLCSAEHKGRYLEECL